MSGIPRRALQAGGVVAAAALVLAGCLQNPNASGGGGAAAAAAAASSTAASADGDKVVTILGAFGGDEEKNFNASLADFEKSSGIDIQYTADQDFTTTIKQKVSCGRLPRHRSLPAARRHARVRGPEEGPADRHLPRLRQAPEHPAPRLPRRRPLQGPRLRRPDAQRRQEHRLVPQGGLREGRLQHGARHHPGSCGPTSPTRSRPPASRPWCIGWESDQATGWVGTDWVEELMLRM